MYVADKEAFKNFPDELKELRQWVCWRMVQNNPKDKPTKMPVKPNGEPASSTDPTKWSRFANCVAAVGKRGITGVGFVFTEQDPYTAIDLDHCYENGVLTEFARKVIDDLDSYTEITPSGHGFHIIVRARVSDSIKSKEIEIYPHKRYFTMTGNVFEGREDISEQQDALQELWLRSRMKQGITGSAPTKHEDLEIGKPHISKEKFLALIQNDKDFKKAWEHQRFDFNDQSNSTYDLSLATRAAMAGCTNEEIAGIIVDHRHKYGGLDKVTKRRDYLQRTISRARDGLSGGFGDKEIVSDVLVDNAMEEGIGEAMVAISNILKTSVDRFIKRGKDPAKIYAVINGETKFWGAQTDLLSFHKANTAWFGLSNQTIMPMKKLQWENHLKRIIALCYYEVDETQGRAEEMQELVELYLDTMGWEEEIDPGIRDEIIADGEALAYDDGIAFNVDHFMYFLATRMQGVRYSRSEIKYRLFEAGYSPIKQIKGSKKYSRKYYKYTGDLASQANNGDDE